MPWVGLQCVIAVFPDHTHLPKRRSSSASIPTVLPSAALLEWCLVYAICNSKSFHYFKFKLYIMIVHASKMFTSYLVYVSRIYSHFGVLNLDISFDRNA